MSDRELTRSRTGSAVRRRTRGWLLGIVLSMAGPGVTAFGQEARPADGGGGLARYVPQQDLFFLLEYDGLDAYPDAWHATAAYKLLTETKLGAMLQDLARQGLEMALESAEHAPPLKAAEIVEVVKQGARRGGVVAAWGKDSKNAKVVLVSRGGDRPEVRRLVEAATAAGRKRRGEGGAAPAPTQKAGRALNPIREGMAWWVENGDLVLSDDPDLVLAVLDGKAPNAVDHPLRAALAKGGDGFQPVALGFLEITALPPMPPEATKLGWDGVKRVELQWGFQDDALRSVIRAVAPSPRRGVLALADQPTFGIDALPPLPPELTGFTVFSIDLAKTYDQVLELVKASNPEGADQIPAIEQAIEKQLGVNVRNEILAKLGPKLSFYTASPAGNVANPMFAMLNMFTGVTFAFEARDEPALSKSLENLVERVNELIRQQQAARGGNAPAIELVKIRQPRPGYVLNLPPGSVPPGPLASMQPTMMLGTDRLAIAGTTAAAQKAMEPKHPDRAWKPTGAFAPVARRLPPGMIMLNFSDPRETIPGLIAMLPTLVPQVNAMIGQAQRQAGRPGGGPMLRVDADQVPTADELASRLFPASTVLTVDAQGISLVGRESIPGLSSPATSGILVALLLPAVQSAREAARRAQCTNNLKQIGLAMHNYLSANGAFPKPAITDKDGKPLLSWRVAILPYIEQQGLYNKFKLDEPWDSPHNKALINEMPATYQCPSRPVTAPGQTTYQVFVGPGALFEQGKATGIADVTDGTSNTMMVVEAKEAMPWTKPDDLKFDPFAAADPSLYGTFSNHPGGFNAGFADGSVRFIKRSISPVVFKALITRASGEVIRSDSF
jgi:prepilin-type processing-associated H-X9-DG protein